MNLPTDAESRTGRHWTRRIEQRADHPLGRRAGADHQRRESPPLTLRTHLSDEDAAEGNQRERDQPRENEEPCQAQTAVCQVARQCRGQQGDRIYLAELPKLDHGVDPDARIKPGGPIRERQRDQHKRRQPGDLARGGGDQQVQEPHRKKAADAK
jgi:hypothetical protein